MAIEMIGGIHAVGSLLKFRGESVTELFVNEQRKDKRLQSLIDKAGQLSISLSFVDKKTLDVRSGGLRHQGIVALFHPQQALQGKNLLSHVESLTEVPLILVLDGVTDPHNLGACLRTADAVGVHAVVIPKDHSAGLTDVVRKVASGAAETVALFQVSNLARSLNELKESGVWLTGASDSADQSLYHADFTGATALVLGAEGKGMRQLTRKTCDHLISIPMAGSVSSLNVSVACGVCLYEVHRQRLG